METLIKQKLKAIEKQKGVKVLYACESGSRAWGFPSPDSDYDVRFIYAHDLDWSLSIRKRKDTIDLPVNDLLDIGGWEVGKALKLLWKSNGPFLEWMQSPIVYHADDSFTSMIKELCPYYFSPIALMHHYQSMAKKYYEACQGQKEVKLKRYFYALRAAMAGKWIREKGSMSPIQLTKMLVLADEPVCRRIYELIDVKSCQSEGYVHPAEPLLNDFLAQTIQDNDLIAASLPSARGDFEKLDRFYRAVVKSV
ncbi:nucleotidyltransferase domain-containing protein [Fulvivirga kasyanovii]|uniref:Nucleotidyltransferase domain-containing protein n=1 Tax=Fulvivirga kasyanovii TaxID=396812 RepID=A0ABW9RZW9_9BACT|nr:nucleotidyltransferase domain-containing protein [Fulvivirga kasyanovii]MTI28725.1 nucleotidyltransferase domain-containing protein [Fulvivirga kasyanovii]